jgi:hypothetical protein
MKAHEKYRSPLPAMESLEKRIEKLETTNRILREALEKLEAIWIGGLLSCPACKSYAPGHPIVHKPDCWLYMALVHAKEDK